MFAQDVVRRPIDRRVFLAWAARGSASLAAIGAFGSLASACGGGSGGSGRVAEVAAAAAGVASNDFSGLGVTTLKVGVIVPTSGVGQFLGDIVQRALGAAKQHIAEAGLVKGVKVDYVIENAPAEEFADGTSKAYNKLIADPDIVGILWCTPFGIDEAKPQLQRDGIPVMSVYGDPYAEGKLYPDGGGLRNVFQMLLPDTMSFDALCNYAKNDRKYASAALIYDKLTLPTAADQFRTAAKNNGLDVVAVEEFTPVLRRLRRAAAAAQERGAARADRVGTVRQHRADREGHRRARRRLRRHAHRAQRYEMGAADPRVSRAAPARRSGRSSRARARRRGRSRRGISAGSSAVRTSRSATGSSSTTARARAAVRKARRTRGGRCCRP